MKQNSWYWIFSISIALILTLPVLLQQGMFLDAVLYTSVAKNMAEGYGTFWFPQFGMHNSGELASFHEQPPLIFFIQSIVFRIFGSHWLVERIYTLFILALNGFLIAQIWKIVFPGERTFKSHAWWPILLWICIPVCFANYSKNMHENTMSIFILLSVLAYLKLPQKKHLHVWVSGFFIFLASLSKGVPGLFTISLPIWYYLFLGEKKEINKRLVEVGILIFLPTILYFLLIYFILDAKESLSIYFYKRLLGRIEDAPTVNNRFYILIRLASELLVPILLCVLLLVFNKKHWVLLKNKHVISWGIFFLCLGLSGALPLLLTKVQKGFYFVAALPYFGLGLGILTYPILKRNMEHASAGFQKIFKSIAIISVIGLVIACCFTYQTYSRNEVELKDVHLLGQIIPSSDTLGVTNQIRADWGIRVYLMRYYRIDVDDNPSKYRYYLVEKTDSFIPSRPYQESYYRFNKYRLYKK